MNLPRPEDCLPTNLCDLLPLELISEISSHLDAQALCRLSQSCRSLRYLSTDESTWLIQLVSVYSNRWRGTLKINFIYQNEYLLTLNPEMITATDFAAIEKQFSRKSWFGPVEKIPGLHKQFFMHLKTPESKLKRSNQAPDKFRVVKVLTLGNSGVGKSALLLKYIDNVFEEQTPDKGLDFKIGVLEPINPKLDFGGRIQHVKAQFWVTAGQVTFRTISSAYYRGTHTFILAYAVNDRESFDEIVSVWAPAVKSLGQDGAKIVVVACKIDLPRDQWKVSSVEGRILATSLGSSFVETSAKDDINVSELFGHATTIGLEMNLKKDPAGPPISRGVVTPVVATAPIAGDLWDRFSTWVSSALKKNISV
jgi:small GTP-binding protein